MPVFRVDPPLQQQPNEQTLFARHAPGIPAPTQPSPTLAARLEQLSKACYALSQAARKAGFDLHNERIQFPSAFKLVVEDIESDAHRLSALLHPSRLESADAEDSSRRFDSSNERAASLDASKD